MNACSLADLAAASFCVKGEVAWLEAEPPGFPGMGKEVPDFAEDFNVGSGVGPEAFSDRGLVDEDEVIDLVETFDGIKDSLSYSETCCFGAGIEDVIHQCSLPCTGDTCDADHDAKGNPDIDPFQVMFPCIPDQKPSLWCQGRFFK